MLKLRYLGRQDRVLALYEALADKGSAMHPVELSKETGLGMMAVQQQLEGCREVFLKLPRNRDGLVRWRLTTTASAMADDAILDLVRSRARVEQLTLYAGLFALLSVLLLVTLMVVSTTRVGFG